MEWKAWQLKKEERKKPIDGETALSKGTKQALGNTSWQPLPLSQLVSAGQGRVKHRRLNSASIGVLARRAIAGEKRLP